MKDKIRTLSASCLCNGVSMKITGEFRPVINCHCIQCTKTHGNFAAYTSVLESNIEYKSKKTLKWYKSSTIAKRGFCKSLFLHFLTIYTTLVFFWTYIQYYSLKQKCKQQNFHEF